MTMQHTPGPWSIVDQDAPGSSLAIVTGDDAACEIASIYTDATTPQQALADARLIASAPALLATLKLLCDFNPSQHHISEVERRQRLARSVITQAEGQ